MVLAPFPGGGSSSLAVAPEHPSQLLLSPYLGISALCSNSEPTENPLRWLLVSEEGEWQREGGRDWDQGFGPPYTSQSLPLCRCCSRSDWKFEVPPCTTFSQDCQVFQLIVFCFRDPCLVGAEAGDRTWPGQLIRLPDLECP